MPVIHPSAPSSARSSAATFASPQQRAALQSPVASSISTFTPKRSLERTPGGERLREQHAGVDRDDPHVRRKPHELVDEHRLLLLEGAQHHEARVVALHRLRQHLGGVHAAAASSTGVSSCVHHSGSVRAREVAERLAVGVVLLVEREDPQQGLVELPVRDLLDHDLAEARLGPEAAADADVHRLDELAVDLLEHALDADVGDLVLRAARRAAREVQPEVLAVAVRAHVLVEEGGDLDGAALRVDLGQPAELLAGAGLQAALEERRGWA